MCFMAHVFCVGPVHHYPSSDGNLSCSIAWPVSFTSSCRRTPHYVHLCCCCSVAKLCLTLCDPMDCSTPGFPVHHQLPEFTQTHVHQVDDATQPSHLLSPPSPPALSFPASESFPMSRLFTHWWPKYWSFSFSISSSNEYSGLISFRIHWFDLLVV